MSCQRVSGTIPLICEAHGAERTFSVYDRVCMSDASGWMMRSQVMMRFDLTCCKVTWGNSVNYFDLHQTFVDISGNTSSIQLGFGVCGGHRGQ